MRGDKGEAFFFFFTRESGKWAERGPAARSEPGESYIKASEQLFGETASAPQMKDVEQTQGEQRR